MNNENFKYGLSLKTINKLIAVFESFTEIEKVVIFGSRVLCNYREGSDIDFAINGNLNFDLILKLNRAIDKQNLPYKIDLLDYVKIKNPDLVESIDKFGEVFYQR